MQPIDILLIDKINTCKADLEKARRTLQQKKKLQPLTDQDLWQYAILRQCSESLIQTCLNLLDAYKLATLGTLENVL